MSNFAIAFDNYLDTATLSGGAWSTGLPLDNLKTVQPTEVARSTAVTNASTQFDVDLGSTQLVKLVALPRHNASLSATWRVRAGTDPTFAVTLYDSGTIDIWSSQEPFGTGAWGEFTWGGKLDAADSADFRPLAFTWISDAGIIARYVRVEIFDTGNVDGYFEAGRAYVSSAYQPTKNVLYGFTNEFVDNSTKKRSRGGQLYVDVVPKFRRMSLTIDHIDDDEMYNTVQEIGRLRGKNGDMIVILDPEDTEHAMRQSIYGAFSDYGAITHSAFEVHTTTLVIEEML